MLALGGILWLRLGAAGQTIVGAGGLTEVKDCREFRFALQFSPAHTIVVTDSFACDPIGWGTAVMVTRNVTVTGRLGSGRSPLIDWGSSAKLVVASRGIQVVFKHLIFVQMEMGLTTLDIGFFGTRPQARGNFVGIVVGVRSCPIPISNYRSVVQTLRRPADLPGPQTTSELGRNTLLVEDMAVVFNSQAVWRICYSVFQCGVSSARDLILEELLEGDETKGVCLDLSSPRSRGGSLSDHSALVVITVSAFGAMVMLCVVATLVIVWLRRRMQPSLLGAVDMEPKDPPEPDSPPRSFSREADTEQMLGPAAARFGGHWNLQLSEVQLDVPLGKGGFGRVFRGSWQGTTVAVKIIRHNDRLLQTNVGEPFEAFLSKHISHPNVVQTFHISTREISSIEQCSPSKFFDSGAHRVDPAMAEDSNSSEELFSSFANQRSYGDGPGSRFETWIVLEYCDGGSLAEAVKGGCFLMRGPVRAYRMTHVLRTALEIANAMNYLHSVRIIHGDLKPGNVLLKGDNSDSRGFICKVGDFGLSRFLADESHIQTCTFGTVTHMPPELLKGGVLTPAADVYSFGILLWELLSGHQPYPGKNQQEITLAVVIEGLRPEIPSHYPAEYAELLRQCWLQDYNKRPSFPFLIEKLRGMMVLFGRHRGRGASQEVQAESAGTVSSTPSPRTFYRREEDMATVSRSEEAMSAFCDGRAPLPHGIKKQLVGTSSQSQAVRTAPLDFASNSLLDSVGSDIGSNQGRLYSTVGFGSQFAANASRERSVGRSTPRNGQHLQQVAAWEDEVRNMQQDAVSTSQGGSHVLGNGHHNRLSGSIPAEVDEEQDTKMG